MCGTAAGRGRCWLYLGGRLLEGLVDKTTYLSLPNSRIEGASPHRASLPFPPRGGETRDCIMGFFI